MRSSYEELQIYLANKEREKESANNYIGIGNINERQAQLLKIFTNNQDVLMYAKEVATRFSVSVITARGDLHRLVTLGLLEEVQVDKKTTAYRCADDFVNKLQKLKK